MAHGMEGRRRSGRKTADPLVDLRTHQPARLQKPARKLKMPAQIVVPVEVRSRSRRVHYAKSDHAASIPSLVHDSRLSSQIHSSKRVRSGFDGRRVIQFPVLSALIDSSKGFRRAPRQSPARRGDRPRGQAEVKSFSLRLEMNVSDFIPAVQ